MIIKIILFTLFGTKMDLESVCHLQDFFWGKGIKLVPEKLRILEIWVLDN